MEQRVTPYLLYEDGAAAIEFLTKAFGFREEMRTTGSAGGMHAELEVAPDGGWIYLGQPLDAFSNPSVVGKTALMYVVVDDVDSHYTREEERARESSRSRAPADNGHGRYGCNDPQGHEWYFAQPLAEGGPCRRRPVHRLRGPRAAGRRPRARSVRGRA
jgi:PhnB protein